MARHRSLRLRYGLPFAVVGAIAIGAALPPLSSAATASKLPVISVQQLIAKAESSHVGAMQGTVRWTANLGLPDIASLSALGGSGAGDDFDWASLVSGTHGVKVWSDGDSARLALIGSSSEVDLYSNSASTWVYDSVTNTATHLVPSATPATTTHNPPPSDTPEAMGQELLRTVLSNTDVAFDPSRTIAGQPAYVVSLTPRPGSPGAAATTLARLAVAVDADNGMILQAALYSTASPSPALEVGYSSLDVLAAGDHLPASEFAFSPGPGVKVNTRRVGATAEAHPARPPKASATKSNVVGSGWGQVLVVTGSGARFEPPAQPATPPPNHAPHHRRTKSVASQLDSVTTAVSGSWGSGRLLSTNLLNVLLLPNGDVIAGFVNAPALEAAAASAG